MKKLSKWYLDLIEDIPDRALTELNKQAIISFSIYIVLFVFVLSMKLWLIAVVVTAFYLLYDVYIIYQMYLFKKNKMVELQGICTYIGKDTFPYRRNYLLLSTGSEEYKVILNKKQNVILGNEILLYSKISDVMVQESYIMVYNNLMLFTTRNKSN